MSKSVTKQTENGGKFLDSKCFSRCWKPPDFSLVRGGIWWRKVKFEGIVKKMCKYEIKAKP